MDKIQKDLDKTQSILQDSIHKLLHRGERLEDLSSKTDDLMQFASTFKKSARKLAEIEKSKFSLPKIIKPKENVSTDTDTDTTSTSTSTDSSDDYKTSIEDTDISEYIEQLKDYYKEGEYQYVLDKSSQLGLVYYVKKLLTISEDFAMNLDLSEALNAACYYGHVEVVEVLLNNDIENERYFGRKPRVETESVLPFFSSNLRIPYINKPLTHDNIRNAILRAHASNHLELAKIIETYYYRTHAIKDRHDVYKAKMLLS